MTGSMAIAQGDGCTNTIDDGSSAGSDPRHATTGAVRARVGRSAIAAGLMVAMAPLQAQISPSAVPGSLVVDPQQGATPRPLPASPVLPPMSAPAPVTVPPPIAMTVPPASSIPRAVPAQVPSLPAADASPADAWALGVPGGLPAPGGDPLHIDPLDDPILQLAHAQASPEAFRAAIRQAVIHNPALDEAIAQADEAEGARAEARARVLPVADLSLSTYQVVDRAFSNDPGNVLERSRPDHRTDGLVRIQQPIVDFGSSLSRIRASQSRLDAARAAVEDSATQIALRAVSAWYTVYGYRVIVRLGEAFAISQRALRTGIEARIGQGAAAPGDIAQVDSYIASSDSQLADFRRRLAGAEAQYGAIIGSPAPPGLSRAAVPALDGIGAGTLARDTDALPAVRAARFGADAARSDARALKSDRLPQVSAGLDAGRYGIVETRRDYDIRGSLTLSMRLGGGAAQRVDQAQARAVGADARLRRTRIEAQRDAEIALSDVRALEDAQVAMESNYLAGRRSRDVLAERFRVARGTLFDVLGAESNYFGVAARLVQTVIELDTARYALLARTGRLLSALAIQPAAPDPR